jgi:mono/diheme cytochrome c family protein
MKLPAMMAATALTALVALVTAGASAQEAKVVLKDAPGKDKAMQCVACHSVDYIQMNSRFLDKAGWTASINKMINAFGAPIAKEDVEVIATYLAQNYGKQAAK